MLTPDWHPGKKQLRQFGAAASLVLLVVADRTGSIKTAGAPLLLGSVALALTFFAPMALRPPYRLLAFLALPIGFLVSEIFLRLVFYGVLTPLGLVFRMIGRDPLRLKRPREASHWRSSEKGKDASGYFRQA